MTLMEGFVMKRLGVVLSAVAMAAGAAVMGASAAAAPGIVQWSDGRDWHTIVNPDGCYDTPGGRKLKNNTSGPIVLYTDEQCFGMEVYTVKPGGLVPPPDVYFKSFEA
ncbi:hypothetical protein [Actinopolyspora mortivallis]|uniref:Secreted protein n=1 Tax=Actinopolyspora mortivallis TaxID=33906 RepID=A0A2T0GVX9_ACTMO|nr:hypothetical protein [Actinopolyspora mortivallis]PRW63247.1 hypothetical protein CEP50_11225 [Actinopolyspora mortivallis]